MNTRSILFALLVFAVGLTGCKDATIEADLEGSLQGTVRDFATSEPLGNVSVTSSPPTEALVTNSNGQFDFGGVASGNYTITASKDGYQSGSVTVSVRENRTTQATMFLRQSEDDATNRSLSAQVVAWSNIKRNTNSTSSDSLFTRVEYRIRNAGQEDIPAYEVYFRIVTDSTSYLQEVTGENLLVGQSDVGDFEQPTDSQVATDVSVEDYWFEGQDG